MGGKLPTFAQVHTGPKTCLNAEEIETIKSLIHSVHDRAYSLYATSPLLPESGRIRLQKYLDSFYAQLTSSGDLATYLRDGCS